MCSKYVEAWKLVKYWDKYTEMHGQQNVKIRELFKKTLQFVLKIIHIQNFSILNGDLLQ